MQWFNSNKGRSCLHWPVWNSSGQNHRWTKCFWKLKLLIDQLPPVMSKHKKYWLHQILSNFPMNRTWSSRTSLVPRNDLGRLSWPKQQHNQVDGLDFIFAQHCNRHFIASMESAAFVDIIHTNGDLEPSAASLWVRAECILWNDIWVWWRSKCSKFNIHHRMSFWFKLNYWCSLYMTYPTLASIGGRLSVGSHGLLSWWRYVVTIQGSSFGDNTEKVI